MKLPHPVCQSYPKERQGIYRQSEKGIPKSKRNLATVPVHHLRLHVRNSIRDINQMPPALFPTFQPRVVCYHQTHFDKQGGYVSILPILTEARDFVGITHLIIAAIHLNEAPGQITLNDDPPDAQKNAQLWEELKVLQDVGIKVLGMLGGAAQGSFQRLDQTEEAEFEAYYKPLQQMVHIHNLDGLDLDVEEEMSLAGIIRLIDRLKSDFGDSFLITMSPVARALQGHPHLSGFDYEAVEVMRGASIAWYHVQFYNNWGYLPDIIGYDTILSRGWQAEKIVVGVLTNPGSGVGWIPFEELKETLAALVQLYPRFGGVFGWEYFNSLPGGCERPWEWGEAIMKIVRNS